MSEPLRMLEPLILRHLGTTLEGDIFQVLKASPYVVRAWEFALADGAIDCSRNRPATTSFAERLWHVFSYEPGALRSDLLLFDLKSNSGVGVHGGRVYITTVAQRRRVAFYICASAAGSGWVELYPNYKQERQALDAFNVPEDERRSVRVNVAKTSRLFEGAHRSLDPCGSPFRMPVSMLPEALKRIRQCALGLGSYVNPWTGVSFPAWRPIMTKETSWLKPAEESHQYTAFEEAWELFKGFRTTGTTQFDMVGLQPLLADWQLVRHRDGMRIQRFIQEKVEGRERLPGASLKKVSVQRKGRYFFDTRDRHDFLCYGFEFAGDPPERVVYFLPESVIPDDFYTSMERERSFDLPEFVPFRVVIDAQMSWVRSIEQIIDSFPNPRKNRSHLPPRPLTDEGPAQEEKKGEKEGPAQCKDLSAARKAGTLDHRIAMEHGHRRFFYSVIAECASRGRGILVELARNHQLGDFAYCRYRWTEQQRQAFAERSAIPVVGSELPQGTPMVPVCYYVRHRETWLSGQKITAAQFRRINASPGNRLIIWDLSGPDTNRQANQQDRPILAIVPSEDVRPTSNQKAKIESNIRLDRSKDWDKHTPSISALLSTGISVSEYTQANMPLAGACDWSKVWTMLDDFASLAEVEHPLGFPRKAPTYRHPLQRFMQSLSVRLRGMPDAEGVGSDDFDEVNDA